jgi:hypothetical protein
MLVSSNNKTNLLSRLIGLAAVHAICTNWLAMPVALAEPCKPCQQKSGGAHGGAQDNVQISVSSPFAKSSAAIGGSQSTTLQGGSEKVTLEGGTQSTTLEGGTQSTTLEGGTQSTMLQGGTQSTTLQGGTGAAMLQLGTDKTMIQGGVQREEQLNILLLMDSSHSMDEALDGSTSEKLDKKITVAKHVLEDTIQVIPSEIYVGLRIFGQSFKNDSTSDCQQSVLTVPIGPRNRKAIVDSVRQLRPSGLTPLAFTLMNAERDFRGLPGIHHVILISDGMETCGGDPCTYIKRLSALGIKMKVDIVGFGLKHDKAAREQLNCIAESSGGHYYDAETAGQLRDSIKESVKRAMGNAKVCGKVITRVKEPVLDPTKIPAGFR